MNRSGESSECMASWKMTDACNFRCGYCNQDHSMKPKLLLDPEAICRTLDDTGMRWVVSMTGGEPFVYPHFVELCVALSKRHRIAVDTNLSLTDRIGAFAEDVPADRVSHIFASIHIEERERLDGLEGFIESANLLQNKGFNLIASYVLHPRLLRRFHDDREYFMSRGVKIQPKPLNGSHDGKQYPAAYSIDEMRLLREYNPGVKKNIPFRSRGLPCWAGRKLVRIWPDGKVTRCISELTVLGQILTGIELLEGPEPCRVDECKCLGVGLLA